MMEHVRELLDDVEKKGAPTLKEAIESAKKYSSEIGQLTREEADKVGEYIRRDMHDAADYLSDSGKEFRDWLNLDLQLIERRILDMFASVADRTRIELEGLAQRARAASQYHTGEVVGPGTLECLACGQVMQFHQTGQIPPCPKCHATAFRRIRS
jgi:polyhydroxyalkanoate synthesis regulator phasin